MILALGDLARSISTSHIYSLQGDSRYSDCTELCSRVKMMFHLRISTSKLRHGNEADHDSIRYVAQG
jgi:hypothetical protein